MFNIEYSFYNLNGYNGCLVKTMVPLIEGEKTTHLSHFKYKYIKIQTENRQKADTLVDQALNLQHQHTPFCIQKSANRGRRCV